MLLYILENACLSIPDFKPRFTTTIKYIVCLF
jgi:hypothetical protein